MSPEVSSHLAVCKEIDQWPSPVPGQTLNLPVMGVVLQVRTELNVLEHLEISASLRKKPLFSGPSTFENRQTRRKSSQTDGQRGEEENGCFASNTDRVRMIQKVLSSVLRTSCRRRLSCPQSTSWICSGPSLLFSGFLSF